LLNGLGCYTSLSNLFVSYDTVDMFSDGLSIQQAV